MLDKISTRLHEINENPKYRFVLDLLCISILTLALVFCFLGAQGCLGTRTVYAAEEETWDLDVSEYLGDSIPPLPVSVDMNHFAVTRCSNGHGSSYWAFDFSFTGDCYLELDGTFYLSNRTDSDVPYTLRLTSISTSGSSWGNTSVSSGVVPAGSIVKVADGGTNMNHSFVCTSFDFKIGSSIKSPNFVIPERPLPPFSITTLGDYCMSISGGLFGVAKDAIDFVMDHPIALFGVILFIFVSGSGIVKSMVKGV